MLDTGEPIKIVDLARDLIRLSGLEEGTDIEIEYTGIRPGEKLYEEVFFGHEDVRSTNHPKVLRTISAESVSSRQGQGTSRRVRGWCGVTGAGAGCWGSVMG